MVIDLVMAMVMDMVTSLDMDTDMAMVMDMVISLDMDMGIDTDIDYA